MEADYLRSEILTSGLWRLYLESGFVATNELMFISDGSVGGYSHPNEAHWNIIDGNLCFFRADKKTITTRFDEVIFDEGATILRGRSLIDRTPNRIICLEKISPQTHVLSLGILNAGINNQKMALLGLIIKAQSKSCRVKMPPILRDFTPTVDGILKLTIDTSEIIDVASLSSFIDGLGILSDRLPFEHLTGKEAFGLGTIEISKLQHPLNSGEFDRMNELVCRFIRACRPVESIRSKARELLNLHGGSNIPVLQLRIERDWQDFSNAKFANRDSRREEVILDLGRILEKVKASPRFSGANKIIVCCDEDDLLEKPEDMNEFAKSKFGVELSFKSFIMREANLPEGRLARSAIDFEMALLADAYIGMSRSSFSNMLCLTKYALHGPRGLEHYIYNNPGPSVALRTDFGVLSEPCDVIAKR